MLISESYRQLNADLHTTRPDYGAGKATSKWYPMILDMAQRMGARSILDYACGKGGLGKAYPHLMVKNYDPAIPEYSAAPEPADFVVCTDALEHIEPECLDDVLDDLKRCARRAIFLTVATGPAQKTLADGRNAHLIQQQSDWWVPKLMARWEMRGFQAQSHDFLFIGVAQEEVQAERAAA